MLDSASVPRSATGVGRAKSIGFVCVTRLRTMLQRCGVASEIRARSWQTLACRPGTGGAPDWPDPEQRRLEHELATWYKVVEQCRYYRLKVIVLELHELTTSAPAIWRCWGDAFKSAVPRCAHFHEAARPPGSVPSALVRWIRPRSWEESPILLGGFELISGYSRYYCD
jgi:hypothetical protein